jgi:hypothetical protein
VLGFNQNSAENLAKANIHIPTSTLAEANGNSIIPNQMFFFISSIYFVSVFFGTQPH